MATGIVIKDQELSGSTAAIALTSFSQAVQAGDLVVFVGSCATASRTFTIADNAGGNTWVLVPQISAAGVGQSGFIAWCVVVNPFTTVTATINSASGGRLGGVVRYAAGTFSATPGDAAAATSIIDSTSISLGTGTLAQAAEQVLALCVLVGATSGDGITPQAGAGWNTLINRQHSASPSRYHCLVEQAVSATTSVTAQFGFTTATDDSGVSLFSLKLATAAYTLPTGHVGSPKNVRGVTLSDARLLPTGHVPSPGAVRGLLLWDARVLAAGHVSSPRAVRGVGLLSARTLAVGKASGLRAVRGVALPAARALPAGHVASPAAVRGVGLSGGSAPAPFDVIASSFETEPTIGTVFTGGAGAGVGFSTANPRRGLRHVRAALTGPAASVINMPAGSRVFAMRFGIYHDALPTGSSRVFTINPVNARLQILPSGQVTLNIGGGTVAATLVAGSYYVFELLLDFSGTTWVGKFRVDGGPEQVASPSGHVGTDVTDVSFWSLAWAGTSTVDLDDLQIQVGATSYLPEMPSAGGAVTMLVGHVSSKAAVRGVQLPDARAPLGVGKVAGPRAVRGVDPFVARVLAVGHVPTPAVVRGILIPAARGLAVGKVTSQKLVRGVMLPAARLLPTAHVSSTKAVRGVALLDARVLLVGHVTSPRGVRGVGLAIAIHFDPDWYVVVDVWPGDVVVPIYADGVVASVYDADEVADTAALEFAADVYASDEEVE